MPSSSLDLICPFLSTEHRVPCPWLGPSLLVHTILLCHLCVLLEGRRVHTESCGLWWATGVWSGLLLREEAWLGLGERFIMRELTDWLVCLQRFSCLAFIECGAGLSIILSVCCSYFCESPFHSDRPLGHQDMASSAVPPCPSPMGK